MWQNMVWSDFGQNFKRYFFNIPTEKLGDGSSIMLWGSLSSIGTEAVIKIAGSMDSFKYHSLLAQNKEMASEEDENQNSGTAQI